MTSLLSSLKPVGAVLGPRWAPKAPNKGTQTPPLFGFLPPWGFPRPPRAVFYPVCAHPATLLRQNPEKSTHARSSIQIAQIHLNPVKHPLNSANVRQMSVELPEAHLSFLRPLGAHLGLLELFWASWAFLGLIWGLLGPPGALWASWSSFGPPGGLLGLIWVSWGLLEPLGSAVAAEIAWTCIELEFQLLLLSPSGSAVAAEIEVGRSGMRCGCRNSLDWYRVGIPTPPAEPLWERYGCRNRGGALWEALWLQK